jgi:hypothetical protein
MKELNSDFSKAKVGDKVYHADGSIYAIVDITPKCVYSIELNDGKSYTYDGKWLVGHAHPIIFTHPVKIIHADDMPVNPRIAEIESQIQRLKNELETLKEISK